MPNALALPAFSRAAEVRADSFNEADNTIDVVWSTGARVRRYSWSDGPFDEELEISTSAVRLDRLNAGAPFLDTHDSYELAGVLGAVVAGSAKVENGRGVATIKLSRAPEDASVIQKIRDGIINNISVGYRIHKAIRIEGQAGEPPLLSVVDWEPLEISAVPVPADPGARVRQASDGRSALETYPCVVVRADASAAEPAPVEDTHMSTAETAAETRGTIVNPLNLAPAAPLAPQPDPAETARQATTAERARAATLQQLATRAGVPDFAAEHVATGTSVDVFRAALLDKLAADQSAREGNEPVRGQLAVEVTGPAEEQKRAAAIESALLHRFDPNTYPLTDHGREFRSMTLIEIAKDMLAAGGHKVRGLGRNDVAAFALTRSGGMMSTSDFPAILANVANKTLRAGYAAAPQTFRPLIRQTTVPDFKEVSRTQLGEAPQLEKVNQHGEFKRGKMGDMAEKYAVSTYGKIVALTRQVIINDDLEAFTRIPWAFGVQAANLESDLVWAQIAGNPVMADGKTLFHAGHGNLLTGATISAASVGVARQALRQMTGLDGKTRINVVPVYLIGPTALETTIEQFLGQIVATKSTDVVPESLKKLVPITEPRLDDVSASSWYIAGSPNQIDIVELAYLEGAEGVYTETRLGFDVDGMEIKVRSDVGAKIIDHRGLVKNPN